VLASRVPTVCGLLVVGDGADEILINAPSTLQASAIVGKCEIDVALWSQLLAAWPQGITLGAEKLLGDIFRSGRDKGGENNAEKQKKEDRPAKSGRMDDHQLTLSDIDLETIDVNRRPNRRTIPTKLRLELKNWRFWSWLTSPKVIRKFNMLIIIRNSVALTLGT
jgi:hypothetical protein